MKLLMKTLGGFAALLFASVVLADWQDLSDIQFDYSSRATFDRINRQYSSVVTITNTGTESLSGDMRLMIDSSNHEILNSDGIADEVPYKVMPFSQLDAGESQTVTLKLELKRALVEYSMRLQQDVQVDGMGLELDDNQIALFYKREDGNYDGWGLHLWNGEGCGNYAAPTSESVHFNNWPNPYPIDGVHPDYGGYYILTIEPGAGCYNFIVHRGDDKALGNDNGRFEPANGQEAFTFHGFPDVWYTPLTSRPIGIDGARAHWVDDNSLLWLTGDAAEYRLYHSANAALDMLDDGVLQAMPYVSLQTDSPEPAHYEQNPHLASFTGFALDVTSEQAKQLAKQQLVAVAFDSEGNIADATQVQIPRLLDYLYTSAEDDADEANLGATFDGEQVTLAVWAPTALEMSVKLFDANKILLAEHAMDFDGQSGVWHYVDERAVIEGLFYRYALTVYHPLTRQIESLETTDPYSVGLSTNGRHSLIVDLADDTNSAITPDGWVGHDVPAVSDPEDIVVYETHIRDFSILDDSVSPENRGKYMAFTESNSVPVQHLQNLQQAGLTHLHLLPANDIATIQEDESQRVEITDTVARLCQFVSNAPVCGVEDGNSTIEEVLQSYAPSSTDAQALVESMRGLDGFNWGYDPHHFAAPEGSYASDPDGAARIKEMRAMNMALHDLGLRVVLDVVYNHTASSGLFDNSVLDKTVPGYYHRLSETTGQIENSTCCENTATEHKMMAKLMTDSLVSFAQYFGFDSFRFDLMGHVPKQAVLDVREAVQAVDPDSYFYGEGWNFGEVVNDRRFEQATQFNMAGTEVGTFNDRIREAVRSGNLFNADGGFSDQDTLRISMAGNLRDYQFTSASGSYVSGFDYLWNGQPAGYAIDPADSINYVSKHDNETLWDQLQYNLPTDMSLADRTRVHNVALSIPLLSQGIPFLHMGSELLRSKSMDRNTFDAGDWFNKVDFNQTSSNWNVGIPLAQDNQNNWDAIATISANPNSDIQPDNIMLTAELFNEFLSIRSSSKLFRLAEASDVSSRVKFHNVGEGQTQGLIVMSLDDGIGLPDIDPNHDAIVVLVNGSSDDQPFFIADARNFELHAEQQASADTRVQNASFAEGTFNVPALTTAVFVKVQAGAQGTGLSALPPYGDQAIYLRGQMNGWDTSTPFTFQGNDTYGLAVDLEAGTYEFKIADVNFSTANIGGGFNVPLGQQVTLSNFGNNLTITVPSDDEYRFELIATDSGSPLLTITSDSVTPPPDLGPYVNPIYLRGQMNDWGTPSEAEFSYQGDNVYQLSINLTVGRYAFKIAEPGWSSPNIGGTTSNQTVLLDTPWGVTNGGGSQDLFIDVDEDVLYSFVLDANDASNPTLTISVDLPTYALPVYLRGEMNDWGLADPMVYQGNGVYETTIDLAIDSYQFKIASEDWSTVVLGYDGNVNINTPQMLFSGGGNVVISPEQALPYVFTLDSKTDSPSLVVSPD